MPQTIEQNATQGAPAEPERTFTQAQMDSIIGDRLAVFRPRSPPQSHVSRKA